MIIKSKKIPKHMKELPALVEFINNNGLKFVNLICEELEKLEGSPSSSNISYKVLSGQIKTYINTIYDIKFKFYWSKNPIWGKNVISHATDGDTINYNTRFHSASNYQLIDWISNFAHELTHLVDQESAYSFDHDGQNDYNAAPMVVARIARVIYQRHEWK